MFSVFLAQTVPRNNNIDDELLNFCVQTISESFKSCALFPLKHPCNAASTTLLSVNKNFVLVEREINDDKEKDEKKLKKCWKFAIFNEVSGTALLLKSFLI